MHVEVLTVFRTNATSSGLVIYGLSSYLGSFYGDGLSDSPYSLSLYDGLNSSLNVHECLNYLLNGFAYPVSL